MYVKLQIGGMYLLEGVYYDAEGKLYVYPEGNVYVFVRRGILLC